MAVDKGKWIFVGFRFAGIRPRLRGVVPRKQRDRLRQHAAVAVERNRARVSAQALVAAAACGHDIESAVNITITLLSAIQPLVGKLRREIPQQQRTEILKMLYRENEILIFDEPTAVLTPQEIDELMEIMRSLAAEGKSILFISHKLNEIMAVADRCTVLRKGKYIGTVKTSEATAQSLTDMMVGHTVSLNISRPEPKDVEKRLVIEGLTAYDELGVKRLDDVSFTINAGEVLGIAGVAGSGQRELLESIAGLYPVASGHVTFYPPDGGKEKELVGLDPMKIRKSGISMGKGLFLNRKDPEALANRIWEELGVVTPSTSFPVRRMSGGNVQKVLVGREIAQSPAVLMTAYAVRGLDINTSYTIYNLLTEQKMKGVAVVYVGEDLDVLLELCDRIVVLCGGQVSGVVDARKTDKREVGALMTLVRGGNKDE